MPQGHNREVSIRGQLDSYSLGYLFFLIVGSLALIALTVVGLLIAKALGAFNK